MLQHILVGHPDPESPQRTELPDPGRIKGAFAGRRIFGEDRRAQRVDDLAFGVQLQQPDGPVLALHDGTGQDLQVEMVRRVPGHGPGCEQAACHRPRRVGAPIHVIDVQAGIPGIPKDHPAVALPDRQPQGRVPVLAGTTPPAAERAHVHAGGIVVAKRRNLAIEHVHPVGGIHGQFEECSELVLRLPLQDAEAHLLDELHNVAPHRITRRHDGGVADDDAFAGGAG